MTTFDVHFEGQADGDAVTTVNSDDFGDSPISNVTANGGSVTYSGTTPLRGTRSLLIVPAASQTCFVQYNDSADHTTGALRMNCRLNALPSATCDIFWRVINSSSSTLMSAQLTSTGLLRLSAGSSAQMTTPISAGVPFRIEAQYTNVTSGTGTLNMQMFNTLNGAVATDSIGLTSLGLATQPRNMRIGKILGSPTIGNLIIDDIKWVTGSATPIGAYVVPPTADAGTDQVGVEAFSTVTVTGTDNDDDGTVVTRTWRVISTTGGAATPTLSGSGNSRTFTAPGTLSGTDVLLGYKVTDNDAQDSPESTVTVSVFPAAERAIIGGVQVPMQIKAIQTP